MRGVRVLVCLILGVSQLLSCAPVAQAVDGGVVIAQMYPGTSSGDMKDQEFIELYNNSDLPIDVTGWCVNYIPYTGNVESEASLACMVPPGKNTKLWLSPHGYAILVSHEINKESSTVADAYFDGRINQSRGYIRLVDSEKNQIDKLGWGDVDDDLYSAAVKPASGNSLQRITKGSLLQNEKNNANDFIEVEKIIIHASNVYEEEIIVDECPNLAKYDELPDGYLHDEKGDCQPDSCLNIGGLQISVLDGYDSDEAGNCTPHDECDNIEGAQAMIPEQMVRGEGNDCIIEYSPLQLTEILPNAVGSDSGNEFVEIYNPGETMIDLTFYIVKIGDKIHSFPVGSTIGPGEYRTFSDSQMNFTLVNSSGRVTLSAVGGAIFGDTGVYESADDGESWALINDNWEYTNRPTPGAENLSSIVEADDEGGTSTYSLKPCRSDQFRNPETNRCKKVETDTLKPCKEGQYRSPETNRCRNLSSASTLKPCKAGQYRNPETNRCRNSLASGIPDAAFAVQPVKDTATAFAGWWALGGVGSLAVSYAGWEWRRELRSLLQRALRR